jgi:hypothetical protein
MGAGPTKLDFPVALSLLVVTVTGCHSERVVDARESTAPAAFMPPVETKLACLGVIDFDSKKTWGPDGGPANVPGDVFLVGSEHPHRGNRGIVFYRPTDSGADPTSCELELSGSSQGAFEYSTSTYDDAHRRWEYGFAGEFDPNAKAADIRVRDYIGPWKKLGTYSVELNGLLYPLPGSMKLNAKITMGGKPISSILVSPFPTAEHFLLRALAWDAKGHETFRPPLSPNAWDLQVVAPASKIAKIEVDECDATTLVFRNVSLRPR